MGRFANRPYGNGQENIEKFFRFFFAKRREPDLGVIRLLLPLMMVFWPIVHEEQDIGSAQLITKSV